LTPLTELSKVCRPPKNLRDIGFETLTCFEPFRTDRSFCPNEQSTFLTSTALPINATLIICSTVPAAYLKFVQSSLQKLGRSDIHLIDSPVSGGTVKAADGRLTIMASGDDAALQQSQEVLSLLSEKLYIIPGGVGSASNVKMINQLLAGIHIAAAAEAMGLAAKAGLNTRQVYEIIVGAAGNSWMFENRVPHMLDNDLTPYSALDIFVKDMVRSSCSYGHSAERNFRVL
jgi:3-hydroxyisobutyrate dehydrogenase-like beta-hydroxyacid dehydrogenase